MSHTARFNWLAFFPGIAAVLPLFCCTSCIAWQFGARVGELPDTCYGADISQPVGGVVYEDRSARPAAAGEFNKWRYPTYVRVNEVSYSPESPVLRLSTLYPQTRARDVRQTGRQRFVRLRPEGMAALEFVDELPQGAVARRLSPEDKENLHALGPGVDEDGRVYGCLATTSSRWKGVASVAMVPVFVVDMALTLATNAAAVPLALVALPVQAAVTGLVPQEQQELQDTSSSEGE